MMNSSNHQYWEYMRMGVPKEAGEPLVSVSYAIKFSVKVLKSFLFSLILSIIWQLLAY